MIKIVQRLLRIAFLFQTKTSLVVLINFYPGTSDGHSRQEVAFADPDGCHVCRLSHHHNCTQSTGIDV